MMICSTPLSLASAFCKRQQTCLSTRIVACIFLLFLGLPGSIYAQDDEDLMIVFWNIENCFDHKAENGGKEWSPEGEKHWSAKRFYNKCNAIGKTLLWIEQEQGQKPDFIALAEVENRAVVKAIVHSPVLRKQGYSFVHFDSPDARGIDVALLYNTRRFPRQPQVRLIGIEEFRTRDILSCRFCLPDGDSLTLIVNHHPSKLGGEKKSRHKRERVMTYLRKECLRTGNNTVAVGDFNDTANGAAFRLLEDIMRWVAPQGGQETGSIKFRGKWELIDLFWVSPDLYHHCESAIVYAPFLLCPDKKYAGEKPLRTYSGPRYLGGVSDHLPIILKISRD